MDALTRYRRDTAKYAARAFRFRRTLDALQWSEQVRRMDGGAKFRFDFAPYQREMMSVPYQEGVQATVYMLASRLGKTEVIMNVIGHGIAEQPRRILVMYPTISQAEKWSKETLMSELVAPTPELDGLIGDGAGRRKSGNTILHKLFPGGLMNIFGSNAPGEMRRAKGNLLLADEIDAIAGSESDEGDPLEIFRVRGSEYPDTIQVFASYPSLKGKSKVESMMLQSDWRVWTMPCIHCSEPMVFHRRQLRYDTAKPEDAWLECPTQGCAITDAERIAMVKRGEWIPTRPFRGIAGFHASRMISPHPVQKGFASHLHWAAVQEMGVEKADNREKALRVLVNTFDGEPYQPPEMDIPDPMEVERGAYDYLRLVDGVMHVPNGVLLVTMGIDVQGDRIEAEIVGFGEDAQTYGLGVHIISGKPDSPEPWMELDKVLQMEFEREDGRRLKIVRTLIDSRYRSSFVRSYTRARARRGVFSCVGSTVLSRPMVSKPKSSRGQSVYEVGTHEAKSLIYQRARLRPDENGTYPHGYMHFPIGHGYTESFYQQLLAEQVELKKGQDGDFYEFFSNPDKLRNEALDRRVYAMAAERSLNPNYTKIARNYSGDDKKQDETAPAIVLNPGEIAPRAV